MDTNQPSDGNISALFKMFVDAQQLQTENLGKVLDKAFENFSSKIEDTLQQSNAQIILRSGLPIYNVDNSTAEDQQGENANNLAVDITSEPPSTSYALESGSFTGSKKRKLSIYDDEDALSLTTSENIDTLIDRMVHKPEDVETTDQSQEVWSEVNEEYEEELDVGPEVMPALSSATKIMWLNKMNDEKLKSKLEVKFPSNCQFLDTKRVNKTIWNKASPIGRSKDIILQSIQKKMAKSQVYLLKVAEAISNSSLQSTAIDHTSLLKDMQQSIGLAGAANQDINDMRRNALKYALPKHLQPLAKSAPESDKLLFGDDLNQRVSDILATAKADQAFNKNADVDNKKERPTNYDHGYAKDKVDFPHYGSHQSQNNYKRPNRGRYYQSDNYSKIEQPSFKTPAKRRRRGGRRPQGY